MFQESIVLRNLAVLKQLTDGVSSLESIAESAGYRPRLVERSLRALSHQGLVQEEDGQYKLVGDDTLVSSALELINPWLNFQNESFYEIARDTAAIIHHKSYSEARVKGVLLYGSTLRDSNPRDIDLVVLHDGGRKLVEFTPSRYADEGTEEKYDLEAGHPSNRRLKSFSILRCLGYAEGASEHHNAVRYLGERIEALGVGGDVPEERVQQYMRLWDCSEEDVAAYLDIHGVNNVFDVHILHTGLLGDNSAAEREFESRKQYGEDYAQRCYNDQINGFAEERAKAIHSCNDPNFWHRVLSEGRLYDPTEMDFTQTIEDKFPGALKLFEARSE